MPDKWFELYERVEAVAHVIAEDYYQQVVKTSKTFVINNTHLYEWSNKHVQFPVYVKAYLSIVDRDLRQDLGEFFWDSLGSRINLLRIKGEINEPDVVRNV